ncbi:hypothetical protein [Sinimarinibacterium flocculans]|uniref:Lipoprotein n=2 Tax=Sinimarinibacterium flocculans TaxID=985250 RepID=A0A318EIU8_9GAMM|nr:hypothetical protein [Sinimarinibacterium flocculans]PXV71015.1 hypothetical protein C8D93_10153 [Sinimarinibacterium flocculans]
MLSIAMRYRFVLFAFTTMLSACFGGYDPSQPVTFAPGTAVPVELAVHHLDQVIDQRITLSGLPRAREGRCAGVQPLTRKDWMLTGENGACLWVSGQTEHARLLDLRPGTSDERVEVTGRLLRTDQGVFVLRLDR